MKKGIAFIILACWACSVLHAQTNPFVTVWELPVGQEEIEFYLTRGGEVDYEWIAEPSGQTGSDAFKPGDGLVRIGGLPAGNTIILSIYPENLERIYTRENWETIPDAVLLTDIKRWGDVAWKSMQDAFSGCTQMNSTTNDLPNLDEVTRMDYMFQNCITLNGPSNINQWDVSNVSRMDYMFCDASSFNRDIGNWNVANITRMDRIFRNASAFNQDIGDWNMSNVTTMEEMFRNAVAFNQDISRWDVSNVTTMEETFREATAFNQNINDWNVTKVDETSGMFYDATSFNQPLDKWETLDLQRAQNMFRGATAFNQDISSWDVSRIRLMQSMFRDAVSFNHCLHQWNVSSVINMGSMFEGATAFNQDIGSWVVSAVTTTASMFQDATSFNQYLGNWNLQSVVNIENMFNNCGMDCDNYSATLIGWAISDQTGYKTLGAEGRLYGNQAEAARHYLTTTKGWTINGDAASGEACLLPGTQPNRFIRDQTMAEGEMLCYDATGTIAIHDLTIEAGAFVDYIAGERIIFKPGVVVVNGGYMRASITDDRYCKHKSEPQITEAHPPPDVIGQTSSTNERLQLWDDPVNFFSLYPNPTKGTFTIQFANSLLSAETHVEIYTVNGEKITGKELIRQEDTIIDLGGCRPGVYLIRVTQKNMAGVKKLIIY
jgi:surface protein